ncbi:hypothetical protein DRQ09_07885, partial [candidate division KSB1 bacterium]
VNIFKINSSIKVPVRSKLSVSFNPGATVPRISIRDDLKAGGTIKRKFKVSLTSKGIVIDVSA